jgi:hypothetical protein
MQCSLLFVGLYNSLCCELRINYVQENLVSISEEEYEEYVVNPLNSLALVKRLTVQLDKVGYM